MSGLKRCPYFRGVLIEGFHSTCSLLESAVETVVVAFIIVALGAKLPEDDEEASFNSPRRCFRSTSEAGLNRSSIEPRSIVRTSQIL